MEPSTPIRNSNPNVAKVTASPAARKGILPSLGNDSISPMQRRRLIHQSCRERYQAILETQARATIRTNPVAKRYLKATLPALRRHLLQVRNLQQRVARGVIGNAIWQAISSLRNRESRRKRSAASRARNKKAEKAMRKFAKRLKIDSGPFNPYVLQKDRQLTAEEKKIHLDDDHFLNDPSTRPQQDARILKRELDTNYILSNKVDLPPRPSTNPVYRA